jgi:Na+/H+ antiporter NhaD/arsenite permease-like protein
MSRKASPPRAKPDHVDVEMTTTTNPLPPVPPPPVPPRMPTMGDASATLVNAVAAAIVTYDKKGRIVLANPSAIALMQYRDAKGQAKSGSDIAGMNILEFLFGPQVGQNPKVKNKMEQLMFHERADSKTSECKLVSAGGERFHADITVARSGNEFAATIVRSDDMAKADASVWDDVVRQQDSYGPVQTAPIVVDMIEFSAGKWKQTQRWNSLGRGLEMGVMMDDTGKEKFTPSAPVTLSSHHQNQLQGLMSKASLILDLKATTMSEIAEVVKQRCSNDYDLTPEQSDKLVAACSAKHELVSESEVKKQRAAEARKPHINGAERAAIMVGDVDFLEEPILAFVRLHNSLQLNHAESEWSTRFIVMLLGPPGTLHHLEFKEMGRAMAIAFQNQAFLSAAMKVETRGTLIGSLKGFAGTTDVISGDVNMEEMDSLDSDCWSVCFPKARINRDVAYGGLARSGFRVSRRHLEAERFMHESHARGVIEAMEREIAIDSGHQVLEGNADEEIPDVILINTRDKYLAGIVALLSLGLFITLVAWHFHAAPTDTHESKLKTFNSHIHGYTFGVTKTQPYKFALPGHNFNVMDVKYFAEKYVGPGSSVIITMKLFSVPPNTNLSATSMCCGPSCPVCKFSDSKDMVKPNGEVVQNLEYLRTWNEDMYGTIDTHNDNYIQISTNANTTVVSGMMEVMQMGDFANYRIVMGGIILILVYGAILSEVLHRTLAALLGAFFALTLLTALTHPPKMKTIISYMDEGTLGLLFGMMIMVNLLSLTGFFEWAAAKAVTFSSERVEGTEDDEDGDNDEISIFKLTATLCTITAVLSAFLDNVTTMLLLAPVTIEVSKVLKVAPAPILVAEIMFSNIGGTSTMIGDPPNIIIGNMIAEVSFTDFVTNLAPPVILMSVPAIYLLKCIFGEGLAGSCRINAAKLERKYPITNQPLLMRTGTVFITVILLLFMHPVHHKDAAWIAIVGAIFMLVISNPHELHHTLAAVEWDTLLFFGGLFVMIEALAEMGLIRAIGDSVSDLIESQSPDQQLLVALVLLLWVSAIVSGFLDNIPYTATMVPVIQILSDKVGLPIKPLAFALSLGACLGGNATLVGASANLVTAGIADHIAADIEERANKMQAKGVGSAEEIQAMRDEAEGMKIRFGFFSKIGMPTTMLTVSVSTVWCLAVYVGAGWTG